MSMEYWRKEMWEKKDHSKLQMAIAAYFYNRRRELGIDVFPEQRIQITPTRYRVPDICVTLGEPDEQIFTRRPFLCVEILSLEDRAPRMMRKVSDYLRIGVPFIWTIDPKSREAVVYHGGEIHPAGDGLLWTRNPDLELRIAALFE
jgi:Uma2 family endonuclease